MSEQAIRLSDVHVNQELPAIRVPITITATMASALATRDFQPVHHDLERARAMGSESVFTNTHATAGYLERLVMQWAGAGAFLKSLKLRLGVPNYAGDEMVLAGKVTAIDIDTRQVTVAATGRNSRGDHVTAELVVRMPENANG